MRRQTIISLFVLSLVGGMLLPDCGAPESSRQNESNTIVLIWNKGFEKQTGNDVVRGLMWTFSWLGADLPEGCIENSIRVQDSVKFTVNLDGLGFSEAAGKELRVICDSIRNTGEYKARGGLDVGEFIMLTLGSSNHYYRIVGAPVKFTEFVKTYHLDSTVNVFGVTVSSISAGHRKIIFSKDTSLFHCGFMAIEGHGSLDSGTFQPSIYECFDIMPNGQLRFMIYDSNGNLISGTPQEVGDAGKPTKCLWCHETSIQTLFINNIPVAGMMTNEEFLSIRDSMQARLQRYRFSLKSEMNYENYPEHTQAELLYITYMEPSVMHIANEWKMTEDRVRELLKQEHSYVFEEFDYIGNVYPRETVNKYDTIKAIKVPSSAREVGEEVNYLR